MVDIFPQCLLLAPSRPIGLRRKTTALGPKADMEYLNSAFCLFVTGVGGKAVLFDGTTFRLDLTLSELRLEYRTLSVLF